MKQLIIILILLCCATSNVYAWTDELDIFANETCEFNVNPIFNASTIDNPYWFDTQKYLHANDKTILDPFFRSNEQIDFCQSYDICKYVYDATTDQYLKTGCCITIEECITLEYTVDINGDGYYKAPDNLLTTQLSDAQLIRRYFQTMLNEGNIDCTEYYNLDESSGDNPDIFGINATAGVGNDNLNAVYTGFVLLNGDGEKELSSPTEYGFDLDSICGEGGSGGLSQQMGWGDMTDGASNAKSIFEVLFYMIIPLLFIVLAMRMITKVIE